MAVKRFVVFAYGTYYPQGGWLDVHSAHDTAEDAQRAADECTYGCTQVVDLETGAVIAIDGHGLGGYPLTLDDALEASPMVDHCG